MRALDEAKVTHEDGNHVVPKGRVVLSGTPMYHVLYVKEGHYAHPLDFVPQIWMNVNDLLRCVERTDDLSRLSGCCGPCGSFGTTHLCRCGSWCGTQMEDCWTSWVFIPDRNNAQLQPV